MSHTRTMMEQFFGISTRDRRVTFDEKSDNGLVLSDKYLPMEVLMEIFLYVDCKSLLRVQLVCKRWMMMMKYVWHRKTEKMLGKSFPWSEQMPWTVFYLACTKKPYERNLVRNHSGVKGFKHWQLLQNAGDRWKVEEPPVGISELPQTEPEFKDRQLCFATSFYFCDKLQNISLMREGIPSYMMDTYQPPIVISEWYGCRWDCPAIYEIKVQLIGNDNNNVIDEFKFRDDLTGEKQNQWQKISHVFTNYGTGVRSIIFDHGGRDKSFWKGHYGSKMAGACVCVEIPDNTCPCKNYVCTSECAGRDQEEKRRQKNQILSNQSEMTV